jgi:hypothetical protein
MVNRLAVSWKRSAFSRARRRIWLLGGHNISVILRPQETPGTYVFIGDAYVHGIMYGEFVKEEISTRVSDVQII